MDHGPRPLEGLAAPRADLDAGIVLAFRHKESPHPALQVQLRGLKPRQKYRVEFIDDQHKVMTRTLTGQELGALEFACQPATAACWCATGRPAKSKVQSLKAKVQSLRHDRGNTPIPPEIDSA